MKHILVLTSGTAIAQLISVFSSLITYRIYQPDDYGVLGLFITATTIISVFSTLQYHNAIIVAEKDEDALAIVSLSIYIAFSIIAVLSILLFFYIYFDIARFFSLSSIGKWIFFLPLSVLFTALNYIFSAQAVREKKFKLLSGNRIIAALIVPVFSITLGLIIEGPFGLFFGLLVSQVLPTILLYIRLSKHSHFNHTKRQLLAVAKKYRNFPVFSLPADGLNNFANQLPVLLLNAAGGVRTVGFFNLSNRILGMPSQLISSAVGEVFRQKATRDYFETGSCRKIFFQVLWLLILLGLSPFLIIAVWGPDIFSFFFGEKWEEAGVFSQIFSVLFFFKFVVSPLTYVTFISNKQWISLFIDILLLSMILLIFFLTKFYHFDYKTTLIIYSLTYSILYFLSLWVSFKITINNNYVPKNHKVISQN
ncbi:MAG: oligosaccharide flippase family protein [Agriterribacter sp.]